jgi:hypothetical protein
LAGVILPGVRFEKIWIDQCRATKGIKSRFGAKSALDYLIREKLLNFAEAAEQHPEFARELPRFLAAISRIFNQLRDRGLCREPQNQGKTQTTHPSFCPLRVLLRQ